MLTRNCTEQQVRGYVGVYVPLTYEDGGAQRSYPQVVLDRFWAALWAERARWKKIEEAL
jgi:hypothetical protein